MMPSFEYDIGEKARIGARFIAHVRDEIQRALASEKKARKVTQQEIARKLETDRAVINRQIMGLENMTIRRVAEILWAIGWEPHFEAQKTPAGQNHFVIAPPMSTAHTKSEQTIQTNNDNRIFNLRTEARAA